MSIKINHKENINKQLFGAFHPGKNRFFLSCVRVSRESHWTSSCRFSLLCDIYDTFTKGKSFLNKEYINPYKHTTEVENYTHPCHQTQSVEKQKNGTHIIILISSPNYVYFIAAFFLGVRLWWCKVTLKFLSMRESWESFFAPRNFTITWHLASSFLCKE